MFLHLQQAIDARSNGGSSSSEALLRKRADAHVLELQRALSSGRVPPDVVRGSAECLTPAAYNDVVSERELNGTCGYPCCGSSLSVTGRLQRTTREIIAEAKRATVAGHPDEAAARPTAVNVDPSHEPSNYCSRACLRRSRFLATQLSPVAPYARLLDQRSFSVKLLEQTQTGEVGATPVERPAPSGDPPTSMLASLSIREHPAPAAAPSAAGPVAGRGGSVDGYAPKSGRRVGFAGDRKPAASQQSPASTSSLHVSSHSESRGDAGGLEARSRSSSCLVEPAGAPSALLVGGAINLSSLRAAQKRKDEERRAAIRAGFAAAAAAGSPRSAAGNVATPPRSANGSACPSSTTSASDPTAWSGVDAHGSVAAGGGRHGKVAFVDLNQLDDVTGPQELPEGTPPQDEEPDALPYIRPTVPRRNNGLAPPARRRPAPSNSLNPTANGGQAAGKQSSSHAADARLSTLSVDEHHGRDTQAPEASSFDTRTHAASGDFSRASSAQLAPSTVTTDEGDEYWRTRYGLDDETELVLGMEEDEDELDGDFGGIWAHGVEDNDNLDGDAAYGQEEAGKGRVRHAQQGRHAEQQDEVCDDRTSSGKSRFASQRTPVPPFLPSNVPPSAVIGFGSIEAIGVAYSPEEEVEETEEGGGGKEEEGQREAGVGGNGSSSTYLEPGHAPAAAAAAMACTAAPSRGGSSLRPDGRLIDHLVDPTTSSASVLPVTLPSSRMRVFGISPWGLVQSTLATWRTTQETAAVLTGEVRSLGDLGSHAAEAQQVRAARDRQAQISEGSPGPKRGSAASAVANGAAAAAAAGGGGADPHLAAVVARREYVSTHLRKAAAGAAAELVKAHAAGNNNSRGASPPVSPFKAASEALLGSLQRLGAAAEEDGLCDLFCHSLCLREAVPTLDQAEWTMVALTVAGAAVDGGAVSQPAREPGVVSAAPSSSTAGPPARIDGLCLRNALCAAPGLLHALLPMPAATASSSTQQHAVSAVTPDQLGLLSFGLLHGPEAPWPAAVQPPRPSHAQPSELSAPAVFPRARTTGHRVVAAAAGTASSPSHEKMLEQAERDLVAAARKLAGLPGVPRV